MKQALPCTAHLRASVHDKTDRPLEHLRATEGSELVELLVKHFAGQRICVPLRPSPTSPLAVLGPDNARRLSAACGPEVIEVPMRGTGQCAKTRRSIEDYLRELPDMEEANKGEVARLFGVSRRTVQRVRVSIRRQREARRAALRKAFEADATKTTAHNSP